MTVATPPLIEATCAWCGAFPCVCPAAAARSEPCACGGTVLRAARVGDWPGVIAAHQRTPAHRAWRARLGL